MVRYGDHQRCELLLLKAVAEKRPASYRRVRNGLSIAAIDWIEPRLEEDPEHTSQDGRETALIISNKPHNRHPTHGLPQRRLFELSKVPTWDSQAANDKTPNGAQNARSRDREQPHVRRGGLNRRERRTHASTDSGPIQGCYEISQPTTQDSRSCAAVHVHGHATGDPCGTRNTGLVKVSFNQGSRSSRCGCHCLTCHVRLVKACRVHGPRPWMASEVGCAAEQSVGRLVFQISGFWGSLRGTFLAVPGMEEPDIKV
jgi:hypothetical protein